jgi:hypothetical protein
MKVFVETLLIPFTLLEILLKVYLPTLVGLLPKGIICTFRTFLDFCYLVRRSELDESALLLIKQHLSDFHQYRQIFKETGIRPTGFSLPHQHSLTHYSHLIREFGAPSGTCSSITESTHIRAVKEPWCRSNKCDALGQMLLTNQRMDKITMARHHFKQQGMVTPHITSTDKRTGRSLKPPVNIPQDEDFGNLPQFDDDCGIVFGPTTKNRVMLAKRKFNHLL